MTRSTPKTGGPSPPPSSRRGPAWLVQRKSKKEHTNSKGQRRADLYEAVQIGLVEDRKVKRVTKPQAGHFKKTGGDLPP